MKEDLRHLLHEATLVKVNTLEEAGALHYSGHQWGLGLGWANILQDSHSRKYYIQGKLFIAFKLNAY